MTSTNTSSAQAAIIGAGPIGIELVVALQRGGVDTASLTPLQVERGIELAEMCL